MSRLSRDEIAPDGTIWNGFDYNVQVWVLKGICQYVEGAGGVHAGRPIREVPGHEVRQPVPASHNPYLSHPRQEDCATVCEPMIVGGEETQP